jgi:hypothetical protein
VGADAADGRRAEAAADEAGVIRALIPETPGAGRLGRHVEHDLRSLAHPFDTDAAVVLKSVTHLRAGGIFDQGAVGSCTGNAVAGACNIRPTFNAAMHPVLVESNAVACYELATKLDGFPGVYPPDDTGSSGLAACQAAKSFGWIRSYKWAFGPDQALAALMARPVCVGVNWYEGFDRPGPGGLVKISGGVRGGHEFVLRGFDASPLTPSARLVWADNSWGPGWGKAGRFCFTVATLEQLLAEQGDAVVPIR